MLGWFKSACGTFGTYTTCVMVGHQNWLSFRYRVGNKGKSPKVKAFLWKTNNIHRIAVNKVDKTRDIVKKRNKLIHPSINDDMSLGCWCSSLSSEAHTSVSQATSSIPSENPGVFPDNVYIVLGLSQGLLPAGCQTNSSAEGRDEILRPPNWTFLDKKIRRSLL